ncbi:alginate lyase family protein [Nocardioides astragali]|uniref:Alginate lyase family protein n=1 Tax=Nocardioides astragali TaxID=1776736 RepID=A0ABW2N7G0_9ACTN|nr:alginate lyase family protein [Nocardioides astragali]
MNRPITWYAQRLRSMSPAEVAGRARDAALRQAWSRMQVVAGEAASVPQGTHGLRQFATTIPEEVRARVPASAREAVVAAAERVLSGEWMVLGTPRSDSADPDWFWDPVTGRRSPHDRLAFRIDHRDEDVTGNVKSVWELSRHHHLTVLACAFWLTGEERYARAVDAQLRSWWGANPFLSGVHWTSGIELGVRLTSWVWIRRLLDDWPKVGDLFETNDDALRQIWWHQRFLAAFPSRGSSANNHAVAEACGLLAGSCAFPWFSQSERWRTLATSRLERDWAANTFPSGVNRELASDYHRFVTELGMVALVESHGAGHSLDDATWNLLARSLDAAAAMLDVRGRPPRQGDGDEGRALVVDAPDADDWSVLLSAGEALVGRSLWWPDVQPSVLGTVLGGIAPARPRAGPRPPEAPRAFADAGIYLLRTPVEDGPEIWCRCDGGPHGFLSIAAHAHADALSIEVRHDGVEILVDPGTYCYHGEPEWRSYFRSTLAHNTVEIDGTSQSVETGPFMWTSHAPSRVIDSSVGDLAVQSWTAQHHGYADLDPCVRHVRGVWLDRRARTLTVNDVLSSEGRHDVRLVFHLGPEVEATLSSDASAALARLRWRGRASDVEAVLRLPPELAWTAHRGGTDPVLGWYSPRFGHKVPTTTLLGRGVIATTVELRTTLVFAESGRGGSHG